MSYYILEADNAGDIIYALITCEHCKYFRRADEHEYRYEDSCDHQQGMVSPSPEGFCSYASFKLIEEEDHE